MSTRAYDILKNHVFVSASGYATFEIDGWAEGDDVLTIRRREDLAMDKVGADGNMVISLNPNRSGEVIIRLLQTSPANKKLLQLAGTSVSAETWVPVLLTWQDTYRQDSGAGAPGYIKSYPEIKRGRMANEQEWTIVVANLQLLLGDPTAIAGTPQAVAAAIGG